MGLAALCVTRPAVIAKSEKIIPNVCLHQAPQPQAAQQQPVQQADQAPPPPLAQLLCNQRVLCQHGDHQRLHNQLPNQQVN